MDAPDTHLPVPLTRLVGRETALAELQEQLRQEDCRLLTLTGPPGVGKTRLALALATALEAEFPGHVWFASLAPLRDPSLVPATIAKAVGLREEEGGSGSLEERLVDFLRSRESLLVLDNFEHVLEGAGFVADVLRAASHLRVLVTSQVALRLSGEVEYPVAPLELPPLGAGAPDAIVTANPAVALFVARARAVHPGLVLDAQSTEVIARVCHRLDGIPLAIELAAARSKLFGPQVLLSRLDQRLAVPLYSQRTVPQILAETQQ